MSITSALSTELYEATYQNLERELYINSTFFCEKLICEIDNDEIRFLLAKSYVGMMNIFNIKFITFHK